MKKFLLLFIILFLAVSFEGWGQIITFEFSGLAGNEASAPSNYNDVNLTSSTITRGSGLTASSNAGRFNATFWALTSIANAISGNDYMEFTITPNDGYQFNISSIFIQLQRSSTGPRGIALRSSVDSYATNLDQEYSITDITSNQNFTFTFSQSNSISSVTFRIYMWAESTVGSGGIGDGSGNDIIVYGATSYDGVNNPSSFSANSSSSSQNSITFTTNAAVDNVVIVYNADGSFAEPSGAPPAIGYVFAGGTLLYNGTTSPQSHSGLTSGQTVNYKAWSYDGNDYSTGLTANATPPALIISEVSDPSDVYQARFIELYNAGEATIDFDTETWYLCRQTNGTITWENKQLTGSINSGETYVIANNNDNTADYFYQNYNFMADFHYGGSAGNGDDGYFLYINGDHSTGTLIDAYGVIDQDGTSQSWEYEDDKAIRKNTISTPNTTWTASEWNIVSSCPTGRMNPDSHPETVWNGLISASWTTDGNWDNGLTGSTINVKIWSGATHFPTIMSSAECNNFHMQDGATLLGGQYLTINGTTTIQKNTVGYTSADADDGYYVVTAPVSDMAISGSDWIPVSGKDDFYAYDEANNLWRNYLDGANPGTWFDYFDVGTGYLCSYHLDNDGIKDFTGTLNSNESYILNLSYGNTNWNLGGNPYPSKLSGYSLYHASSMKILDVTDGSWDDLTTDLGICQGFMIFAEQAEASITISRSDQTHGSGKKSGSEVNRMKLQALNDENSVFTWLVIDKDASTSFEWQTDSRYLGPITSIPRLCILTSDDMKVSTNTFSISEGSIVFPVFFSVIENVTITFSLEDFSNSLGVENIILEDQAENKFTTLSEGKSYSFYATTNDNPLRFKLHFKSSTGINENDNNNFDIYSNNCTVYIINPKFVDANVVVYNFMGQEIDNMQINGDEFKSFQLNVKQGYYIVKVISDQLISTEKVYLK